jgi:hypothetical protein
MASYQADLASATAAPAAVALPVADKTRHARLCLARGSLWCKTAPHLLACPAWSQGLSKRADYRSATGGGAGAGARAATALDESLPHRRRTGRRPLTPTGASVIKQ